MALSDVQIEQGQKYLKIWHKYTSRPMAAHHLSFAQAIEAEVRKQDDALIRQLVEALDDGEEHTAQCKNHWYAGCDCNKTAALTAARSRAKEGGA